MDETTFNDDPARLAASFKSGNTEYFPVYGLIPVRKMFNPIPVPITGEKNKAAVVESK